VLRARGLLGCAERASTLEGQTMAKCSEIFVGIDTAKMRHAVAVADAGRDGEVRHLGCAGSFCTHRSDGCVPRVIRLGKEWGRIGGACPIM
jgi:hypothetical protein